MVGIGTLADQTKRILIIGSAPDATVARTWDSIPFDRIVAINNAWRIRPDWDDLIFPYDFPDASKPTDLRQDQNWITQDDFVPVQNEFGGFVYAGATMAFTAAYWVLGHYRPKQICFLGCNMWYPKGKTTHFYGAGTADPLRDDITLMSLEAKSSRLYAMAQTAGCEITNLSAGPTRLVCPQQDFRAPVPQPFEVDQAAMAVALEREAELGYYVPSGRYWLEADRFDVSAIHALDQMWLSTVQQDSVAAAE